MLQDTTGPESTTSYQELQFVDEASLMDHTITSPRPCYDAEPISRVEASLGQTTTAAIGTTSNEAAAVQSSLPQTPFLPCVLPQTSKSFRGAFFSPFVRAYAPRLEEHGISRGEFLTFIDGLNEVFVAHPVFQGLGIAGAVMGMAYGVHPVQWAGMGLQFASGAASAATSYVRTKKYFAVMNESLFHPTGLEAKIMTTKNMLTRIGHPEDKVRLQHLDLEGEATASPADRSLGKAFGSTDDQDPRVRRMLALHGYIMPVSFDVPPTVSPDSLLSRVSAANVKRRDVSQQKKLLKERKEGDKEYMEKMKDAEEEMRKGDEEIAKIEKELAKERSKCDSKMAKAAGDSKKSSAVLKDFEKKKAELLRDMQEETEKRDAEVSKCTREALEARSEVVKKEERISNKVRWIVISEWQGGADGAIEEDDIE